MDTGCAASARRAAGAAAALLLITSLGCGPFGSSLGAEVELPPPPPAWLERFPQLCFTIVFLDAGGRKQEVYAADWRAPVTISTGRRANSPVLAFPWCAGAVERGVLRPAGGLFPLCMAPPVTGEGGLVRLVLTWEDGAAALAFQALEEAGVDTALINAARLLPRMRAAADPWTWDLPALEQRLACGLFTAYDLDPLPAQDAALTAGCGTWVWEDPLAAAAASGPGGELSLNRVCWGRHTLFGPGGGRLGLFMGREGLVCWRER